MRRQSLWLCGLASLLLTFQNCGDGMRARLPGLSAAAEAINIRDTTASAPAADPISIGAHNTTSGSMSGSSTSEPKPKPMEVARMLAMILSALPAGSTATSAVAATCRLPRYYSYELTSDVPLGCSNTWAGRTEILKPTIPDEGMAVVRATLLIFKDSSNGPGGWSVGVYAGVGGGVSSDMADNINPGESVWKTVLGSGELNGAYSTAVRLSGYGYQANSCVPGNFTVKAGSRMEVWVEDPKAECRGKYVGLRSLYLSQSTPLRWGQGMMSMDIPSSSDGSEILLLSSIEGTAFPCASGTLATYVSTNLTSLVGTEAIGPMPTAGQLGQCHLSLATAERVSYSPLLTGLTLHLKSGVSSPVYSGYRDGIGTGEGVVGFVKQ